MLLLLLLLLLFFYTTTARFIVFSYYRYNNNIIFFFPFNDVIIVSRWVTLYQLRSICSYVIPFFRAYNEPRPSPWQTLYRVTRWNYNIIHNVLIYTAIEVYLSGVGCEKKTRSSGVGGWVGVPHLIHLRPTYSIIYIILCLIRTGFSMGTGYLTLGPILIDRRPLTHAWFNNTITRSYDVTIYIYKLYIML